MKAECSNTRKQSALKEKVNTTQHTINDKSLFTITPEKILNGNHHTTVDVCTIATQKSTYV
jgi:hypothetical protein